MGICDYKTQDHNAKSAIHVNNGLTIGEQKNIIQNFYNPLLKEFRHMLASKFAIRKVKSSYMVPLIEDSFVNEATIPINLK